MFTTAFLVKTLSLVASEGFNFYIPVRMFNLCGVPWMTIISFARKGIYSFFCELYLSFMLCSQYITIHCFDVVFQQSRVVQCNEGERSYHIFYQLCAGAPTSLRGNY